MKAQSLNVCTINRYVWLIDLLARAGSSGITFDVINERWRMNETLSNGENYSKRSFHRHRDDIREIFGIDIQCHLHDFTYYITDIDDIKSAKRTRRWILESASLSNAINQSSNMRNRVLFDNVPSSHFVLKFFLDAVNDSVMVSFDHQSYYSDSPKHYEGFMSYGLRLFQNRWYVVGGCDGAPLMCYALDRITNVVMQHDEHFEVAADWNVADFFYDSYGVLVDADYDVERVVLAVTRTRAHYLRSLPLHRSQIELKQSDGSSQFVYRLRPTDDFVHVILGLGSSVKVLEPQWLRGEVKAYLMESLEKYSH